MSKPSETTFMIILIIGIMGALLCLGMVIGDTMATRKCLETKQKK